MSVHSDIAAALAVWLSARFQSCGTEIGRHPPGYAAEVVSAMDATPPLPEHDRPANSASGEEIEGGGTASA